MTRNELLELKETIEKEKVSKIQNQTKLDSLTEEMKEKWGCETIEDAKNKIQELDKEISETYEILKEQLDDVDNSVSVIESSRDEYEL